MRQIFPSGAGGGENGVKQKQKYWTLCFEIHQVARNTTPDK